MEISLEQVEQLKEKASVSYRDAKAALERSRGNMLDALIFLEDQGYIPKPEGTRFTTREEAPPPPPPPRAQPQSESQGPGGKQKKKKAGLLTRLRWLLLDNELEIWRKGEPVTGLPLLVLILLLIYLPWATFPLLILGLFVGFRYRFAGPDLEKEELNNAMDQVADTAGDLGRRMAEELRWRPVPPQPEARSGGDWLDEEDAPGPGARTASAPSGASRPGAAAGAAAAQDPRTGSQAEPKAQPQPNEEA